MDAEERERRDAAEAALGVVSKRDLAESMRMIRKYATPYCELLARTELGQHLREMVAKIPRSRKWRTSNFGRRLMATALQIRELNFPQLLALTA